MGWNLGTLSALNILENNGTSPLVRRTAEQPRLLPRMKTNFLQLTRKRRPGGTGVTQRDYLDFVVDGRPLSERIGGDLISCLVWTTAGENARAIRRLLLEEPADFGNERRSLYVCPECGDLGCGAVSAVVKNIDNQIRWHVFGFENNYENIVRLDEYRDIGPFVFEKRNTKKLFEEPWKCCNRPNRWTSESKLKETS